MNDRDWSKYTDKPQREENSGSTIAAGFSFFLIVFGSGILLVAYFSK